MSRFLITGLLIASQLLLGTVTPLYACVAQDGTVSVDWGAGFCHCREEHNDADPRHADDQPACSHDHGHSTCCSGHHEDTTPLAGLTHECSCTHVPLSGPPSAPNPPQLKSRVDHAVRLLTDLAQPTLLHLTPATPSFTGRHTGPPSAPPPAWGLLASPVLRC